MKPRLAPCRDIKGVKDVRVMGATGVVELDRIDDIHALRVRFLDEGVLIRPVENVVYLTPSFTIGADDLATLTGVIVNVVASLKH